MPACPRDSSEYSSLPPPGFTGDSSVSKRVQLIELLDKVADKYRREPQLIEHHAKQTDLLLSIAQYVLLSDPISNDDRRHFLQQIVTTGTNLLTEDQQSPEESSCIDSSFAANENNDVPSFVSASNTPDNDNDGDFSLEDLANEYLKNEPSSNEKPTSPSEGETTTSAATDSNETCILSKLAFPSVTGESMHKSPLELILFSNRLSSHNAAATADCIWKEDSSALGQLFCSKTIATQTIAKKRVSSCLLDRPLYERLTRLITLLPKQCPLASYSHVDRRISNPRAPHQHPNVRHPGFQSRNRPNFRPNLQMDFPPMNNHPQPRHAPPANFHQHPNSPRFHEHDYFDPHYNLNDRGLRHRYPHAPPLLRPRVGDYHNQPRGPQNNNPRYGGRPQTNQRNSSENDQLMSSSSQHQRAPQNNSAGNKFPRGKSSGHGPSSNPR